MKTGKIRHNRMILSRMSATVLVAGITAQAPALADDPAFIRTADSAEIAWGPCPEFMPKGCALAVLQGNPAERNADVFFKLPAGTTAPLHWHSSAERMLLVAGEMRVQYEGQDAVVLKVGTYAYGPATLRHDATCVSDQDCILFIAFEEPVDAIAAGE